jgi:tRNA threonylcarbamoyladenosine biosynthesis protein TsaB
MVAEMRHVRHPVLANTLESSALIKVALMNILALDTSGEYCSAALWLDANIDERETHAGQRHSELLLGMIDELLARHDMRLPQLDGIAYSEGPGTFTGLRIACGVTQGLAMGAGVPVAGVGTLLAMAQAAQKMRVVCCIDARIHEVYHAAYERSGDGWREVHAPGVYAPDDAPELAGDGWHGCGNGFAVYGDALRARYEGQLSEVNSDAHPSARDIAGLAARVFREGGGKDAALAAPLYIRDKVALKTSER